MIWSLRVRLFHWVNAFAVFGLIILGLMMTGLVGGLSHDQTELLVPYHIGFGVLLIITISYRLYVFATSRNQGESAEEANPFSNGNIKQLKNMRSEKEKVYKYHNPIGRMMVFTWFIVLISQSITGSILSVGFLNEEDESSQNIVKSLNVDKSQTHVIIKKLKVNVFENEELNKTKLSHEGEHEESEIHEFHETMMFTIILMLFLHVGGVVKETIRSKTNLIKKMIYGTEKD